jgi:hypothetical protein
LYQKGGSIAAILIELSVIGQYAPLCAKFRRESGSQVPLLVQATA